MLVTLDDSTNTDRNQIYLRRGALPTRDTFDYRYSAYSADEQIYVPYAAPGDWYILIYGDHIPTPSGYTVVAQYSDLRITAITPDRYATDNLMTMTLTGGGFEPGTTVKLVSGATTIPAQTADIDSFTQLTATFNLAVAAPLGKYDVRVEGGPLSYTFPQAFTTLPVAPAHLDMHLVMPGFPTRVSARTFRVEYANTGNVAMPAPLIIVQSGDPQGDEHPILSLDLDRMLETFWGSTLPPDTSERIMVLGSGAVAGVLNPGEHMSITAAFLGDKAPFETTDLTLELEMLCVESDGTQSAVAAEFDSPAPPDQPVIYDSPRADLPSAAVPAVNIDWDRLKDALQPSSVPDPIWDNVYDRITAPLGSVNAYVHMLIENAKYLGRLGERVVDVDELWNFELRTGPGLDHRLPHPRQLGGRAGAGAGRAAHLLAHLRRRRAGAQHRRPLRLRLGRPLDRAPDDESERQPCHDSRQRRRRAPFVRDSRGSTPLSPSATYISGAGDPSTLRRVSSGIYELRDTGGTVTRFRADGRLDYVQDANANRTTASYDGSGRLTSLTHSSGGSITLEYNGAGRVSKLTDSTGHVVTYAYDAAGDHLLSASGTDGSAVQYDYDTTSTNVMLRHALLGAGRRLNHALHLRCPGPRRFVRAPGRPAGGPGLRLRPHHADRRGGAGRLYFDHHLRLAKVTNALGVSSVMRYDADDHLASVTLPDGSQQHYTWCDCGSLMSFTDELGNTVAYTRPARTQGDGGQGPQRQRLPPDVRRGRQPARPHLPRRHVRGRRQLHRQRPAPVVHQPARPDFGLRLQHRRPDHPPHRPRRNDHRLHLRRPRAPRDPEAGHAGHDARLRHRRGRRPPQARHLSGRALLEYDYDDAGRRVAIRDPSGYTTALRLRRCRPAVPRPRRRRRGAGHLRLRHSGPAGAGGPRQRHLHHLRLRRRRPGAGRGELAVAGRAQLTVPLRLRRPRPQNDRSDAGRNLDLRV